MTRPRHIFLAVNGYGLRHIEEVGDETKIVDDQAFWDRLEYVANAWLGSSADRELRRFWIDGFIPDASAKTKRGLDVQGRAWVGEVARAGMQYEYRFIASIPKRLLNWQSEDYEIESLSLDHKQELLEIVIEDAEQTTGPEAAPTPST